jgi:hypothetical protein
MVFVWWAGWRQILFGHRHTLWVPCPGLAAHESNYSCNQFAVIRNIQLKNETPIQEA